MVEVNYKGRLGNNMFQYAFGRIIAETYNLELDANYLKYFENTKEKIYGKNNINNNVQTINGHKNDIENIDSSSFIKLDGYFQYYPMYKNYKEKLKKWFYVNSDDYLNFYPDKNDIIIHIRLRDYKILNFNLKENFYYDFINENLNNYNKFWIITDEKNNKFINELLNINKKVNLFNGNEIEDFCFIKESNNILTSQSTFSWWAAFLSNAKKIYIPYNNNNNCKSAFEDNLITKNLFVDDEKRYKKIYI